MQAPPAPSSGDKLDLKTLKGALLHITVSEYVKDIETSFGKSDAVRADVVVLDGDLKGTEYNDTLFFPVMLRGQLKGLVGDADPVALGRLGQGDAKPGKSAPWMLLAPTEADFEVGRKYAAYAEKKRADEEEPF